MLNTYLAIVSHPLFFTFIALCGGVYALLWATSLKPSALPQPLVWLRQHYVSALLIVVGVLFVLAMTFYLVEIGLGVRRLVDLLGGELAKTEPEAEELRFLAHSIGILVAILAGSATIFFASIRVSTNERNTTATEQGLITDRINKAVEGLGAEKTVKQQRQDSEGALLYGDDINGNPDLKKPIMAEVTKPNIEVRIGSILALERLAKENLDFHIQIMEILCAYVREMAKNEEAKSYTATQNIRPRIDIQLILTVIGRRGRTQRNLERLYRINETTTGYRLDLSHCRLVGADISNCYFSDVDLSDSDLRYAKCRGTDFTGAILRNTIFSNAKLAKAYLDCALLIDTDIRSAEITSTSAKGTLFLCCKLDTNNVETSFAETQEAAWYNILYGSHQNTPSNVLKTFNAAFIHCWNSDTQRLRGMGNCNELFVDEQPSIPRFINNWERWLLETRVTLPRNTPTEYRRLLYE
ncbi:pentapeptide repeat-containing protein [Phaeobacter inhibens]|uniref:pentapeptide repeat-containing protein n=1 Tax=Phaeobacter inhibens TaxID=221822 RepID=UPI0021A8D37A|nr:pentapeptide repeat-containing protein [Phaeobacter inhibens]UWR47532.1 pentapeptide repeat-containing protein [Phaeobacter inhibens]